MKTNMYYFAYGSNIDENQMKDRCGTNFERFDIGILHDYRLTFTKKSKLWKSPVADIIKVEGDQVLGIMYFVTTPAIKALDLYEGYHHNEDDNMYKRITVTVEIDNKPYKAFTYQSDDPGFDQPADDYLDTIIDAMKENEFPDEYVNKLKKLKH